MRILTKLLIIPLTAGVILAASFGGYCFYASEQKEAMENLQITFKNVKTTEYGEEFNPMNIIQYRNGDVVWNSSIDTSITGKQTVIYKVSDGKLNKTLSYEIEVVDTNKPIIELKEDAIEIEFNKEYDPYNNILKVYDVIDGEIADYDIVNEVNASEPGTYFVTIAVKDKNGNSTEKTFEVTVKEPVKEEIINDENIEPTYINGIILVNKKYHVSSTFKGVATKDAVAALYKMQADASALGYDLTLISGHRSYEQQAQIYNSYVSQYGEAAANRFSARPGESEHQTGLAFDVGQIKNSFGDTPAGQWLDENCAKYGFIIRYPEGKEEITGYQYEPWHIRYVGIEHAQYIMENGITLEEYLGVAK